jgi:hypothetical protein
MVGGNPDIGKSVYPNVSSGWLKATADLLPAASTARFQRNLRAPLIENPEFSEALKAF